MSNIIQMIGSTARKIQATAQGVPLIGSAVARGVEVGIDYAYVRVKRARILEALGKVTPGSHVRIHSADPRRKMLDELAAQMIVQEYPDAVELVRFDAEPASEAELYGADDGHDDDGRPYAGRERTAARAATIGHISLVRVGPFNARVRQIDRDRLRESGHLIGAAGSSARMSQIDLDLRMGRL